MSTVIDKQTAIDVARLRELFSNSKSALITSTLLAFLLAFVERGEVSTSVIIAWFSLIVLVNLMRAVLIIAFQRSKMDDHLSIKNQLVQFRCGVLIAGVVWGSVGFLFFPFNDQHHQMFLIFIIAGISAGGMISYSADIISAVTYSISILTPLIINLFIQTGSLSLVMGASALLYLGFIIMNSRQINFRLNENIVLSLDALEKETEVRHHANNLELNNQILSYINQNMPLPYIIKELVLRVEALHPSMICSILLVDQNGKTLHTVAAPSLPNFYNQAIEGLTIGYGVGSCGTAVFLGERIIVEDVQQHPYWADYRDLASRAGLRSCWSEPFKDKNGRVLGTFGIYHNQVTQPNQRELNLMSGFAILAQLVVESCQAQNNLNISAIAFESQDGMVVTDTNKKILRVNRAFTKITGYAEQEVVGEVLGAHGLEKDGMNVYSSTWSDLEETEVVEDEVINIRKSGETYTEQVFITKVKDANGITSNFVASFRDITISKKATEEIQYLAYYDTLTNLPNRRLLVDRLKNALLKSQRTGRNGALLFIDLDHFKTLNDSLGHYVGDLLLQQVAERLTSILRESDTVARLGGDEYVVMLEGLSGNVDEAVAQAGFVGEKKLTLLKEPFQLDTKVYQNTVSIGIALFSSNYQSFEEVLKHADIAMYQAKKHGRNSLRFFDPNMQMVIHARMELEYELRKAIELEQFQLYYQIQIDHLGNPIGAEALIRWNHPEQGLVSPLHFIPLAEETGLILPIGQWVLKEACKQLKTWEQTEQTKRFTLSINISAIQFHKNDFVETVVACFQHCKIDHSLLKFELTESILLEDIEDAVSKMNSLKNLGIQFSLDDFGTGYSSLQYLKLLPLDQLKIDQSFVRDLVEDKSDRAIVRTIIAIAESLELKVIAEGVETEEQLSLLAKKGCKYYQGYLFGRPVPIDEFNNLLKIKSITDHL